MLNDSIRYHNDLLYCDHIPVEEIAAQVGTPVYVYSLRRALHNLERIKSAFAALKPHIHYSAKANANLAVLRALGQAGAGVDAVSGGEIYKALKVGIPADQIVFAGVGKTPEELRYAVEQGVGWFNVENLAELALINQFAGEAGRQAQIALRLNPEVSANTHPYIATGHGGAKFGLTAESIAGVLRDQSAYPHLRFAGIHIHIGSQLGDAEATVKAVRAALALIAPYPQMRVVNIGGGLPVAYKPDQPVPDFAEFANVLTPLLKDYTVLLEPGRAIIADAGTLIARVLYTKQQAGQTFIITDASMAELIRPALYQAHHEIVPVKQEQNSITANIVGPVCETADVLGRSLPLPDVQTGDLLAALTAGAYGMVMASNYNQRLRPAEVVVSADGASWHVARPRETWADLVEKER